MEQVSLSKGITIAVIAAALSGLVLVAVAIVVSTVTTLSGGDDNTTAQANYVDVGTMCSAISTYPDKYVTIVTSSIPPAAGSGDAGTAASYRRAADMIDDRCPSHSTMAEKLRDRARYLDPGHPDN
ncbi:hypothetical protein GCM10009613_61040 [Pseudonocardia kongjuensis]|uniref:Secreted protein n=1 Tax=Pseudonocardia kongjuensis TaxID=102227 RepID=A0ABN1YBX8_9PSEU